MRIDLNCDLGEGARQDDALMPLITSANIACGAHAGDALTMRRCLASAQAQGVAPGAHPGYRDPEHFGRRELRLSPVEVFQLVREQLRELQQIASEVGTTLRHVKPHGALYNLAARDAIVAAAVADAVYQAGPGLILFGLSGSFMISAAEARGLAVAREVFADRSYQPDGSLTPRSQPGALLADAGAACAQVVGFVRDGTVRAVDGTLVSVRADTVCLHGDGPHAVDFARCLREALAAADIEVKPFFP